MRERKPKAHDPVLVGFALLFAAAAFLLHAYAGPEGTYWTIDNGGKALAVANLQEDAGRTWLRYPGRDIDPELRFFPQPLSGAEPYGVIREGKVVSQYLSPFAWLVLPCAELFGYAGLGLLPALAGGAAVLLTGWLGGRLAALIAVLASPLLFYSGVLWEHTLVVALAAGGLLLLRGPRRMDTFGAGLLFGLASVLREEIVLLLAGAALASLASRDRRRQTTFLATGGTIGVLLRLLLNKLVTGSIVGIHVGLNRPEPFRHLDQAVEGLVLGSGFSEVPLLVVLAAFAVLAVALLIRRRTSFAAAGEVLGAAGALLLAAISALAWLRFPGGEDRALALIRSNSLLVALPWVLLLPFLLPRRRKPDPPIEDPAPSALTPVAGPAVILFLILFVLLCPERSITGVHPGPRMLLPALPLFAATAAAILRRGSAGRHEIRGMVGLAPLLLLLAIGIAWNLRSLELLAGKRAAAGAIASELAAAASQEYAAARREPESGAPNLPIVATDLFWLPTEMADLWDRIEFHLIRGPADLQELSRRATVHGARELHFVTAPGSVRGPAPIAKIRNSGYPGFSVDVHVQRLPLQAPPGGHP